mgnify:CR=1 FL=1
MPLFINSQSFYPFLLMLLVAFCQQSLTLYIDRKVGDSTFTATGQQNASLPQNSGLNPNKIAINTNIDKFHCRKNFLAASTTNECRNNSNDIRLFAFPLMRVVHRPTTDANCHFSTSLLIGSFKLPTLGGDCCRALSRIFQVLGPMSS